MATRVTRPFASALEAQRERFNALFNAARRERPRLEPAAFLDVVGGLLGPVVEAVAAVAAPQTAAVTEALYDLALTLFAQDLLGPNARQPLIAAGWRELFPQLARFLAERPQPVAAALSNALYNLSITPGARPAEWLAGMTALAEVCPDSATLLTAGQVAAWRAGLAHYRLGALTVARQLPPAVARAALGLPASPEPVDALLAALMADPWRRPDSAGEDARPRLAARAGAFRGFGGLFLQPPRVTLVGEQFFVHVAEETWLLTADVCGATFHRAERQPPTNSLVAYTLKPDGALRVNGQTRLFPELAGATSSVANRTTLAVTTAWSHAVCLLVVA